MFHLEQNDVVTAIHSQLNREYLKWNECGNHTFIDQLYVDPKQVKSFSIEIDCVRELTYRNASSGEFFNIPLLVCRVSYELDQVWRMPCCQTKHIHESTIGKDVVVLAMPLGSFLHLKNKLIGEAMGKPIGEAMPEQKSFAYECSIADLSCLGLFENGRLRIFEDGHGHKSRLKPGHDLDGGSENIHSRLSEFLLLGDLATPSTSMVWTTKNGGLYPRMNRQREFKPKTLAQIVQYFESLIIPDCFSIYVQWGNLKDLEPALEQPDVWVYTNPKSVLEVLKEHQELKDIDLQSIIHSIEKETSGARDYPYDDWVFDTIESIPGEYPMHALRTLRIRQYRPRTDYYELQCRENGWLHLLKSRSFQRYQKSKVNHLDKSQLSAQSLKYGGRFNRRTRRNSFDLPTLVENLKLRKQDMKREIEEGLEEYQISDVDIEN